MTQTMRVNVEAALSESITTTLNQVLSAARSFSTDINSTLKTVDIGSKLETELTALASRLRQVAAEAMGTQAALAHIGKFSPTPTALGNVGTSPLGVPAGIHTSLSSLHSNIMALANAPSSQAVASTLGVSFVPGIREQFGNLTSSMPAIQEQLVKQHSTASPRGMVGPPAPLPSLSTKGLSRPDAESFLRGMVDLHGGNVVYRQSGEVDLQRTQLAIRNQYDRSIRDYTRSGATVLPSLAYDPTVHDLLPHQMSVMQDRLTKQRSMSQSHQQSSILARDIPPAPVSTWRAEPVEISSMRPIYGADRGGRSKLVYHPTDSMSEHMKHYYYADEISSLGLTGARIIRDKHGFIDDANTRRSIYAVKDRIAATYGRDLAAEGRADRIAAHSTPSGTPGLYLRNIVGGGPLSTRRGVDYDWENAPSALISTSPPRAGIDPERDFGGVGKPPPREIPRLNKLNQEEIWRQARTGQLYVAANKNYHEEYIREVRRANSELDADTRTRLSRGARRGLGEEVPLGGFPGATGDMFRGHDLYSRFMYGSSTGPPPPKGPPGPGGWARMGGFAGLGRAGLGQLWRGVGSALVFLPGYGLVRLAGGAVHSLMSGGAQGEYLKEMFQALPVAGSPKATMELEDILSKEVSPYRGVPTMDMKSMFKHYTDIASISTWEMSPEATARTARRFATTQLLAQGNDNTSKIIMQLAGTFASQPRYAEMIKEPGGKEKYLGMLASMVVKATAIGGGFLGPDVAPYLMHAGPIMAEKGMSPADALAAAVTPVEFGHRSSTAGRFAKHFATVQGKKTLTSLFLAGRVDPSTGGPLDPSLPMFIPENIPWAKMSPRLRDWTKKAGIYDPVKGLNKTTIRAVNKYLQERSGVVESLTELEAAGGAPLAFQHSYRAQAAAEALGFNLLTEPSLGGGDKNFYQYVQQYKGKESGKAVVSRLGSVGSEIAEAGTPEYIDRKGKELQELRRRSGAGTWYGLGSQASATMAAFSKRVGISDKLGGLQEYLISTEDALRDTAPAGSWKSLLLRAKDSIGDNPLTWGTVDSSARAAVSAARWAHSKLFGSPPAGPFDSREGDYFGFGSPTDIYNLYNDVSKGFGGDRETFEYKPRADVGDVGDPVAQLSLSSQTFSTATSNFSTAVNMLIGALGGKGGVGMFPQTTGLG